MPLDLGAIRCLAMHLILLSSLNAADVSDLYAKCETFEQTLLATRANLRAYARKTGSKPYEHREDFHQ